MHRNIRLPQVALCEGGSLNDFPKGFHSWPGNREPRDDGPFQIILRGPWQKGIWNEQAFTREQITWQHSGSGGDVIAVRKA